jgi:hypothetical protein
MAIVYRHIRLDKNQVFYIGIGSRECRAYSEVGRNNHWNSVVAKSEYRVEILFDNLDWESACRKEIEFISIYGRSDLGKGTLVNQTDGGEGAKGRKDTDELKQSKRLRMLESNPMKSEDSRKKVSKSKTGKTRSDMVGDLNPNNKPGAYEKKRDSFNRFLNSDKGKLYLENLRVRYDKTLGTPDNKYKVKKSWIAKVSAMTEEEKKGMTKKMNAKTYYCDNCGVLTNSGNYKRWHGINCKQLKKISNEH